MRPLSIITLLLGFWLVPPIAISQESNTQRSTQSRTQEIVASFNKEKNLVVEVYGVKKEKYKRVVSEPAIKQNIRDYSGVYEVSEMGYLINIQVGSDGSVKATGYDPANGSTRPARNFRLERVRITGSMLTATKVYDDGATEKFEGVFINRTDFISPTDKGVSSFGFGVVGSFEFAGVTLDRLFYQLKQ